MKKLKLFAALSLVLGATSQANAAGEADAPFSDLQGMWYDVFHNVAVEVRGREVIVQQVDTKDITINRHNWSKGIVIGRWAGARQDGVTYRFTGDCWEFGTEKLVSNCRLDSATYFDRPGIKPHWAIHMAGLTLKREDSAEIVAAQNGKPAGKRTKSPAETKVTSTKDEPAPAEQTAKDEAQTAAELAAERHRAVEERNREAQAKYEAELAEQQRQVAEFERAKEDVARKKAAQQAEADRALAKHRAEMEAHAQSFREYQDAQQRHALCTVGDQAACDLLAKGKLAANTPDPGEASTDTDARQCVTEPVLSPNEAFKGSIKAVVVNGCDKPVDVRICLMRTGGWNCGMITALKPQDDWTWWTGDPQDGVYWDARTTGSTRQLGSPQG